MDDFAHGTDFGVLFGMLAVGSLIKSVDFVWGVGVRGAFRSRRGEIFAHGSRRSICNFKIGEIAVCNPVQSCADLG